MTLSGGEVTGQPEFALRLLKMAKENQIHTAIETCGYVQWEVLRTLLEYTDYVMYDLKCMDSERHRRGTGVGNELILQNARRVAEWKPTLFRTPLIPGYNDDEENIMAAARFIREELGLPQGCYELLKYNRMGEVKYGRMAREDEPHMQPQSDEYFDRLNKMVAEV